MYSVVCREVHESRFTLAQLRRSIQRARHRLDNERTALTPDLMEKLLSDREQNDHRGESNKDDDIETNQFINLSAIYTIATDLYIGTGRFLFEINRWTTSTSLCKISHH
jgi:hypothetical protein